MPIDVTVIVKKMPDAADPLSVTLPGGAELAATLPSMTVPDGASLAKALIGQVNSAMAPLLPFFKVTDVALVVVEFLKDLPEVLVNPAKMVELVEKLIKGGGALLAMIPPASVPLLAVGLLDAVIAYLEGLVRTLDEIAEFQQRIADAQAQQDRYPALAAVIEVSEENVEVQMESLEKGMGPLQKTIRLLNLLLQLAGLDGIPDVASMSREPNEAVEELRVAVQTLRTIRSAIPV